LLSIVGFSALLFGIIEGPELGWTAPVTILAFVVAVVGLVGFVFYERWIDHPMLDMAYFSKRPFSMGSFGITFLFLSMFSLFFALTQYLQFVKGYSPLEAGLRSLPFAITMIILAPRSVVIGARVGPKRLVVGGMAAMVIGLLWISLSDVSTPYWRVAIGLVIVASGPALAMPTLTGGILSSVPLRKSGVGSAVNDTTREVGGAIGIAVIGTIISSVYGARVADSLTGLPDAIVDPVQDSAGKAFGVAQGLAAQGDTETAGRIVEAVQTSFADAFQIGLRASAAIAFCALLVMAAKFPSEHTSPTNPH